MTRWRSILAVGAAIGAAALVSRRGDLVPLIRWLDRRGGLASRRGEAAYARSVSLFRGLHVRVVADAVRTDAEVIVDIGAGPGDVLAAIGRRAPDRTLIGIEPSARMRALAREVGIDEVEGRAEAIPLPDASVDLVLSTLSSHHWDDPTSAFREIARILRPDGVARIYDVRFAGFRPAEVRRFSTAAGIASRRVTRRVLDTRLFGTHPYSEVTIAGS